MKAHDLIRQSSDRIVQVIRGPLHARGQACKRLRESERDMEKMLGTAWTWMDSHPYTPADEQRWNDLRRQYERTVDTITRHCASHTAPGDES